MHSRLLHARPLLPSTCFYSAHVSFTSCFPPKKLEKWEWVWCWQNHHYTGNKWEGQAIIFFSTVKSVNHITRPPLPPPLSPFPLAPIETIAMDFSEWCHVWFGFHFNIESMGAKMCWKEKGRMKNERLSSASGVTWWCVEGHQHKKNTLTAQSPKN